MAQHISPSPVSVLRPFTHSDGPAALRDISTQIQSMDTGTGLLFYLGGQPGAGKSEYAAQISELLPGWTVTRVTALSWLKDSDRALLTHISHKLGAASTNSIRGVIDRVDAATVVIIDDVHWADAESLQRVIEFARRMVSGRFALILIGLDDKASPFPDASMTLQEIADYSYILPPLTIEEIRSLALTEVRGRLSATTATDIQRITGGVHGRVMEVLQSVSSDHWQQVEPKIPIPDSWWPNLQRRLTETDIDVSGVLLAASILPAGGTVELIHKLADDLDGRASDEAIRHGLLELLPSDGLPMLSLVRPTDRAVLRSRTPVSTISDLHTRAAEYYRGLDRIDEALMHDAFAATVPHSDAVRRLAERGFELGRNGQWVESAYALTLAANRTAAADEAEHYRLESMNSLISASDIPQARLNTAGLDLGESSLEQDSMLGYLALHEGRQSEARNLLGRAARVVLAQEADEGTVDPVHGPRIAARQVLLNLLDWKPTELLQWVDRARDWSSRTPASTLKHRPSG